jgi:hypothetical protein
MAVKKPAKRASSREKVDLYKKHAAEYAARKTPTFVDVGPANYFVVEGRGAPDGEPFQRAVGALYTVAFTVKMHSKFAGRDYAVTKLEGLWWGDDPSRLVLEQPKEQWHWKLMIRIPTFINDKRRADTVELLLKKGKDKAVADVRIETLDEGRCVQVLHIGPYEKEPETIRAMERFAAEQGLSFHGVHHEIYLSDPRRAQPEKLRTILRHPVK